MSTIAACSGRRAVRRSAGDFRLGPRAGLRRNDADAWQGRLELRHRMDAATPADDADSEQMLKSMISFGITEKLQVSASLPIATTSGHATGGSDDEPDVERAGTRGAGRLSVSSDVCRCRRSPGEHGLRRRDGPTRIDAWRRPGVTVALS